LHPNRHCGVENGLPERQGFLPYLQTMTKAGKRSSFQNLNATRTIATTIGVFCGLFSGVNHGIFEILQDSPEKRGLSWYLLNNPGGS